MWIICEFRARPLNLTLFTAVSRTRICGLGHSCHFNHALGEDLQIRFPTRYGWSDRTVTVCLMQMHQMLCCAVATFAHVPEAIKWHVMHGHSAPHNPQDLPTEYTVEIRKQNAFKHVKWQEKIQIWKGKSGAQSLLSSTLRFFDHICHFVGHCRWHTIIVNRFSIRNRTYWNDETETKVTFQHVQRPVKNKDVVKKHLSLFSPAYKCSVNIVLRKSKSSWNLSLWLPTSNWRFLKNLPVVFTEIKYACEIFCWQIVRNLRIIVQRKQTIWDFYYIFFSFPQFIDRTGLNFYFKR